MKEFIAYIASDFSLFYRRLEFLRRRVGDCRDCVLIRS